VNVARSKRASLQIAELVEHEERMVARASEMAVPDALLLLAVGWADAGVHVEDDLVDRAGGANAIDPTSGEISESAKVSGRCEPSRFEASHLAWRGCAALRRLPADDPAHRRILT